MDKTDVAVICEQFGYTQIGLAKRFDIPYRTVQDWHSGRRKPPAYVVNMITELLKQEQAEPAEVVIKSELDSVLDRQRTMANIIETMLKEANVDSQSEINLHNRIDLKVSAENAMFVKGLLQEAFSDTLIWFNLDYNGEFAYFEFAC